MSGIAYSDLAARLTPEARSLFKTMVGLHLGSSGDRLFILSRYIGGSSLHFRGGDGAAATIAEVDQGALEDIASYGLLHLGYGGRGSPNYRVNGEALAFHRWLMEQEGEPITQVETEATALLRSPEFAARQPGAAHHLREAFALLWAGRTDNQTASEIGDHLRKAMMDLAGEVAGEGGQSERPIPRLRSLADSKNLSDRERVVLEHLVELAQVILRLDHRLNHLRDETDKGVPLRGWEEMRRAAFMTAFVCYELDRVGDDGR